MAHLRCLAGTLICRHECDALAVPVAVSKQGGQQRPERPTVTLTCMHRRCDKLRDAGETTTLELPLRLAFEFQKLGCRE